MNKVDKSVQVSFPSLFPVVICDTSSIGVEIVGIYSNPIKALQVEESLSKHYKHKRVHVAYHLIDEDLDGIQNIMTQNSHSSNYDEWGQIKENCLPKSVMDLEIFKYLYKEYENRKVYMVRTEGTHSGVVVHSEKRAKEVKDMMKQPSEYFCMDGIEYANYIHCTNGIKILSEIVDINEDGKELPIIIC